MVSEVNEVVELLNCIGQFETDIKSANDEAENWRQYLIINEQKAKKFAKVKKKLQHALLNSEKELSQIREKVRKAKKDSDYCRKQVAEYTAAVEAAQRENEALEREKEGLNVILSVVEENIVECILKNKIEIYRQTQKEERRIDAKLELLDTIGDGPYQEDLPAPCIATP